MTNEKRGAWEIFLLLDFSVNSDVKCSIFKWYTLGRRWGSVPISNNPSPPSLALEGVTVAATPDILKRSPQAETVGHCLLGSDSISGETSQSPQLTHICFIQSRKRERHCNSCINDLRERQFSALFFSYKTGCRWVKGWGWLWGWGWLCR